MSPQRDLSHYCCVCAVRRRPHLPCASSGKQRHILSHRETGTEVRRRCVVANKRVDARRHSPEFVFVLPSLISVARTACRVSFRRNDCVEPTNITARVVGPSEKQASSHMNEHVSMRPCQTLVVRSTLAESRVRDVP